MHTGPCCTPTCVGCHNAASAAVFLKSLLECLKVDFTCSLLCEPCSLTKTVLLAVVKSEVLKNNVNAVIKERSNFNACHFACKESIFGVVFKVTSAVGCSVCVSTGPVEAGNACIKAVVCDHLTNLINKIEVECGRHNVLRCKCCSFCRFAFHSNESAAEE